MHGLPPIVLVLAVLVSGSAGVAIGHNTAQEGVPVEDYKSYVALAEATLARSMSNTDRCITMLLDLRPDIAAKLKKEGPAT